MSDRAPASLTIYAYPRAHETKVIELLDEWGFAGEWCSTEPIEPPLTFGDPYVVDEVRLGVCWDLGGALAALGVTFELSQEPKYEWDGTIVIHVPALGTFSGGCDPEGGVYVAASDIDRMISGATTLEELTAALNEATGWRWRQGIRQSIPDAATTKEQE